MAARLDAFAPALEQAAALRRREVSSLELTKYYLDRIRRYNDRINAYCLLTPDLARKSALKVDERMKAGKAASSSLLGVTISIKDLVSVAGYPFTYGSRAFADNIGEVDYFVVGQLKAAGCIILGKTTTPEFGGRPVTEYGLHGITRNPWDLERNSGGSSGGRRVRWRRACVLSATALTAADPCGFPLPVAGWLASNRVVAESRLDQSSAKGGRGWPNRACSRGRWPTPLRA